MALFLARELNIDRLEIETDTTTVVTLLTQLSFAYHPFFSLICDCSSFLLFLIAG